MKETKKIEESEIMKNAVKSSVPSQTYTYIRDLVFAAMITGLILKSVGNAENIATLTEKITNHTDWGETEQAQLNERLQRIEDRLRLVEISVNKKN